MTTATESLLGESNAFLEIIEQASRLAPLRLVVVFPLATLANGQ